MSIAPKRFIFTGTCLNSVGLQPPLACELKNNVSPAPMQPAVMLGEHGDSSIAAWPSTKMGSKLLD